MTVASLFTPQLVGTFESKINKDIKLVEFMNEYRLDMGGLTQSGLVMSEIWEAAAKHFLNSSPKPRSFLLIGFGCGSSAKMLNRRFPKAKLTALEIDPTVIEIGKKYFKTDKIKNLNLINIDGLKFVNALKKSDHYDVVFIDTYVGFQIPVCFQDPKVLKKISNHTDHLLLNRLNWDEHQIDTKLFVDKLKPFFELSFCQTPSNLVIQMK